MRAPMKLLCEIGAAALLLGAPLAVGAKPGAGADVPVAAASGAVGSMVLETGTGRVISLNGAAANIFVADPKVAEVRPASASSLFVFGIAPGHTTIAAMDTTGRVLAQYNLTVQPSSFGAQSAQSMIARLLPGSRVRVEAEAKGLLLTGAVSSPADAAQAVAIAKEYAGDTPNIDNQVTIASPVQVTLNVRIAEMSRTVVRNLGVNWSALGTIGNIAGLPALTLNANTDTVQCGTGSGGLIQLCKSGNFNGIIDALAHDNLAHVLAEPNLTVMSGQSASFQVGGEYPIPVSQQNGTISIAFKSYGIMLSFLPTVMSDGRINIHVKPEVSELDKANGIQLSAGNSTIQVPAITVRRAESTVELGSGQSFAIAGLLQQTTTDDGTSVPGLGDTPVLGALFRDTAFQREEQELVIIITPYIVRPVNNVAALHLPTDGYTPPTDIERLLLMRQMANNLPPVAVRIPGDAGFVVQ
ncbi:MAG TPA: type II and III secretion system protein family protein [Acetobacteraceae bacterium]|nr:type II and III secretion system protein family protein [Acetobacteraceae bacterium]